MKALPADFHLLTNLTTLNAAHNELAVLPLSPSPALVQLLLKYVLRSGSLGSADPDPSDTTG